jgi:hypothetical protein
MSLNGYLGSLPHWRHPSSLPVLRQSARLLALPWTCPSPAHVSLVSLLNVYRKQTAMERAWSTRTHEHVREACENGSAMIDKLAKMSGGAVWVLQGCRPLGPAPQLTLADSAPKAHRLFLVLFICSPGVQRGTRIWSLCRAGAADRWVRHPKPAAAPRSTNRCFKFALFRKFTSF